MCCEPICSFYSEQGSSRSNVLEMNEKRVIKVPRIKLMQTRKAEGLGSTTAYLTK